eukprot:14828533-Alexandrium_andersonii.AAC.1
MSSAAPDQAAADDWMDSFDKLLIDAAQITIGEREVRPRKPWISDKTLCIIKERAVLIEQRRWADLKDINKRIKGSAKEDR